MPFTMHIKEEEIPSLYDIYMIYNIIFIHDLVMSLNITDSKYYKGGCFLFSIYFFNDFEDIIHLHGDRR